VTGEDHAVARPVDLEAVPAVLRGRLEFESGYDQPSAERDERGDVLTHVLRRAVADTARPGPACADWTSSRSLPQSRAVTGWLPAGGYPPARCWLNCGCRIRSPPAHGITHAIAGNADRRGPRPSCLTTR